MPLDQLLHDWQTFYMLTGTAAATLIGLQFVAASLGAGVLETDSRATVNTWVAPTIIHFGSVLMIAAVNAIPAAAEPLLAILIGTVGLVGLSYTIYVETGLLRQSHTASMLSIQIWYAVTPFITYAIILAVGIGLLLNMVPIFNILALSIILLLIIGIRNAYDLTVWIMENHR